MYSDWHKFIGSYSRGETKQMANFIMGIISLSVGVVVLSGVFITTVKAQNTTSWTASEVALWGLLSIVGIAGLVYGVLNVFGLG